MSKKEESELAVLPLTDPAPEALQLTLFEGFFSEDGRLSRTLDIFDSVPKYIYSKTRRTEDLKPITWTLELHGQPAEVTLTPAIIQNGKGEAFAAFPGAREELVELALRKLAVQQVAEFGLHVRRDSGERVIRVTFSLYQLRKQLQIIGHGFKIAEIKEALQILSGAFLDISWRPTNHRTRRARSPILDKPISDFADDDEEGSRSFYSVNYHPLATQAILTLAYYPINYERVMKLKSPFGRWLAIRLSHNFRQARKTAAFEGMGYHLALSTILRESGMVREERLRDNVATVRKAVKEMVKQRILHSMKPVEEKAQYAGTKGRPKMVDVVWTFFPSSEFATEIIEGNVSMSRLKSKRPADERK